MFVVDHIIALPFRIAKFGTHKLEVTRRNVSPCCAVLQAVYTMTEYKKEFPFPVIFPQKAAINTLAEWLSKKKLPQFHCAGVCIPSLLSLLSLPPSFPSLLFTVC